MPFWLTMLEEFIELFLNHLNQQHQRINFTIEYEQDKELPFLDTCVRIEADGTFMTSVFRKKTHTNQYLNFNSNHHLSQKVGTVLTLMKRRELITNVDDKEKEKNIVQDAFRKCDYPEWTLKERKKDKKNLRKKENQPSLGILQNICPLHRKCVLHGVSILERFHYMTKRHFSVPMYSILSHTS